MREVQNSRFARYGLAVLAFLVTLALGILLRQLSINIDLGLLIFAVLIAVTWYLGRGPGFTVVSLLVTANLIWTRQTEVARANPGRFFLTLLNVSVLLVIMVLLVSSRRKANAEIRKQKDWLNVTLSSIGDGIIATNIEDRIEFMNPVAESLTGWKCADALNKPLTEVFSMKGDQAEIDSRERPDLETSSPIKLLLISRDRQEMPIDYTKSALKNASGEVTGSVVVFRDVSDRRRYEEQIAALNQDLERRVVERTEQLENTNRELEAFSYSVSHDLRAPLRTIDGFSQALLEDYKDRLDVTGQDYLIRVRSGTQRMGILIDDLLNLARIGRSDLVRKPVDLSSIAREVAAELSRQTPERDVRFKVEEGLIVAGDPALLRIVMENLLGNAWKFTSKSAKGEITVGSKNHDSETIFLVSDNGAGFDMAYANKLFGAFQRLHSIQEFNGTGIGLATVQRIVHRHGGRVWAEGSVGHGATFYFPSGQIRE